MRRPALSLTIALGCICAEMLTPYPRSVPGGYLMFLLWLIGAVALSDLLVCLLGYTKKGYRVSWGILAIGFACLGGLFFLLETAPIFHPIFMLTMFIWWAACIYGVRYFFMAKTHGGSQAT